MTWFCVIAKKGPVFSLEFFCQNAPLCTAINIDQISQCALMLMTKNRADSDSRYENLALSTKQKHYMKVGSKLFTAASK